MFTGAERTHRQTIGLNTLMDGIQGHPPPATYREMIKRAILGSPHQGLVLQEIIQAIKERFAHYILEHEGWPVSGSTLIIILFPDNVSACSSLLFHLHCHNIMFYPFFSISSDKTSLISAFSDQKQCEADTASGKRVCERESFYILLSVEGGQQHRSANQPDRQD